MSAIDVRDISVSFDGPALFSGLSFTVEPGQKVVFSGRSGSGKSTLLKCLLGFVRPEAGSIFIHGERVSDQSIWRLRTRMTYVAQEPDLGSGKILDAVLHPFKFKANADVAPSMDRVKALFQRFYLDPGLLNKDADTLSGGQKQRVAVVIALLLNRSIYLLDEPTSALDEISRAAVYDCFMEAEDMTVCWVSHDTAAMDRADQVVALNGPAAQEYIT